MQTERELLETILVAEILILSESLKQADQRDTGRKIVGRDYLQNAINQIKAHRPKIIALLQQP